MARYLETLDPMRGYGTTRVEISTEMAMSTAMPLKGQEAKSFTSNGGGVVGGGREVPEQEQKLRVGGRTGDNNDRGGRGCWEEKAGLAVVVVGMDEGKEDEERTQKT
ncbi:hypothetical protein CTAM01_09359 [Colletotrichum tamarilloi]|uniref:Uncharacterized protein n=1 Tax=Colletotrichum tamarilloi TaxID=1209934 RepID=A0ABQ9R3T5_9PEZI|nr:uncharacterized protein CTAM01_09359 [Colletotrichum tamarilloi]KAK1493898.1 hypothetical protein CTAM01_09359 [Colletotrichum tamarilloi]